MVDPVTPSAVDPPEPQQEAEDLSIPHARRQAPTPDPPTPPRYIPQHCGPLDLSIRNLPNSTNRSPPTTSRTLCSITESSAQTTSSSSQLTPLPPTVTATNLWRPYLSSPQSKLLPEPNQPTSTSGLTAHSGSQASNANNKSPIASTSRQSQSPDSPIPSTSNGMTSAFPFGKDRPYQCTHCSNTYLKNSHLQEHKKKHRAPTHQCPNCCKTFYLQSGLNRHLRTHNAPIYQCDLCERAFTQKSHLKRHKNKVHCE